MTTYDDRVIDLSELLGDTEPPPADYIIDGYLERATHMLLCGRGGKAKTMLLNQLAAGAGNPEFPYDLELPVRAERIVWFDAEMGPIATMRRYWRTGLRPYIDGGQIEYVNASGLHLGSDNHAADKDFIRSKMDGADLVVFDSLRKLCRYSSENSSDEMAAVVADITDMAHDLGPGIATIHHQGGDPHKWFRGSTAILDQCDALVGWLPHLHETDEDDGLRRLAARGTWAKIRNDAAPPDRWFKQTDTGLLVPADAPERAVIGKWDAAILAELPYAGTKKALAERCGTNSRNNAWSDAYDRVAHLEGNSHVALATDIEATAPPI